jgi:GT2 family glycosyltransferase
MINKITAVLITSYNRKDQTIKCLEKLFEINSNFKVYLVDDCSNDNTKEEILSKFPMVDLILGDGNLFWNRGMHLAWQYALKNDYDFYLWLNDDVELEFNAFDELFTCAEFTNSQSIITGIIKSLNNEIIYGGYDKNKNLIIPNGKCNNVNYLNGNVVLIPKFVVDKIGILDPFFHHDLGDVEYGWRALKNNIKIITTRVSIGIGIKNEICRVRKNNTTLFNRLKYLYSPLGSNPFINFYYKRKRYGIFYSFLYFIFLHLINFIPDSINLIIFGKKYQ